VLTGEQRGYIEPCGCSETLSGGLSRRADLVKQLNEQGWPVAGLDLGGLLERDRFQSRLKFNMTLDVLEDLDYRAMAVGPSELRLGADTLIGQHQNRLPPTATQEPSFLAANVTIYGSPDISPRPSKVIEIGGEKIGVAAVLSPSYTKKLFAEGAETFIEITSPDEALTKVVEGWSADGTETAFNVLLAHVPLDEAKRLAEAFPQFRIIMAAEGGDEPAGKPIQVDESWILQIGRRGKYAGVLAHYPKDAKQPFRFELIDLDQTRFQNSPLVEKHLRAYQDAIADNLEAVFADTLPTPHPSGSTFVGAKTCGECHTKAYAKWKDSKHAKAYESIVTGREGQFAKPISRQYDTECLACHVTGWDPEHFTRYESGFLPKELAEAHNKPALYETLRGQQCENCHGPGSQHVALERTWKNDRTKVDEEALQAQRRAMTLKKEIAKNTHCVKCHDAENSPKFDFEKYWEEIKHPWRD
jgi:hypothetical protein